MKIAVLAVVTLFGIATVYEIGPWVYYELTSSECDVVALRHLPLRSGNCDSFICSDDAHSATNKWTNEIRQLAERQTDGCLRHAYYGWASFFDRRALENNRWWHLEIRAREREKLVVKPIP